MLSVSIIQFDTHIEPSCKQVQVTTDRLVPLRETGKKYSTVNITCVQIVGLNNAEQAWLNVKCWDFCSSSAWDNRSCTPFYTVHPMQLYIYKSCLYDIQLALSRGLEHDQIIIHTHKEQDWIKNQFQTRNSTARSPDNRLKIATTAKKPVLIYNHYLIYVYNSSHYVLPTKPMRKLISLCCLI